MGNLQLKQDELALLTSLIGKELIEVNFDNLSSELFIDTLIISVEPDDIHIPTIKNPYSDIKTLRIKTKRQSEGNATSQITLKRYGYITDIIRLECLIEIEDPQYEEETEFFPGIVIPDGYGWTNNIIMPSDSGDNNSGLRRALLGLHFETITNNNFTLYTDAVGFSVLYEVGPLLPSILRNKCEQISIRKLSITSHLE